MSKLLENKKKQHKNRINSLRHRLNEIHRQLRLEKKCLVQVEKELNRLNRRVFL